MFGIPSIIRSYSDHEGLFRQAEKLTPLKAVSYVPTLETFPIDNTNSLPSQDMPFPLVLYVLQKCSFWQRSGTSRAATVRKQR